MLLPSPVLAQQQLEVLTGTPPAPVVSFVLNDDAEVIARTAMGNRYVVWTDQGDVTFRSAGVAPPNPEPRREGLPDGVVEAGTGSIAAAWLIYPTTRYDHGILGDAIEAAGLRVEFQDGRSADLRLDPPYVFEDRRVRIVDVDGDVTDELLVVRTDANLGAALALYELSKGEIRLRAAAPPIGLARRWLNPVGVADFDGDGRNEIAAVVTPHLAGILTLYREVDGELMPIGFIGGYSNHAIGSREQGMSAVWDVNGDGAADIIVPDRSYRRVAVVSFAGGEIRELGQAFHPAPVVTNIVVGFVSGVRAAVYGLSDGTVALLRLDDQVR